MNWHEISVYTTHLGIDHVTGALLSLNIGGFSITDAEDFNEFLVDDSFHWDYIDDSLMGLKNCETCIKFYLPDTKEGAEDFLLAKEAIDRVKSLDANSEFGRLVLESETLREEDWAENWKKYFKPIPIGKTLIIKPSWEVLEDNNNRTVLEIDPKMSFGTGTHYTTKLCLELLEEIGCDGKTILDMGCGSGILSVGGLLMGARSAVAVDIDPLAVKTSFENAEINGVADKLTGDFGDVTTDDELYSKIKGSYDIICANIVADVIISMTDIFYDNCKVGGKLLTSGIIIERADEVLDKLKSAGFTLIKVIEEGGWAAAELTR